MDPEVKAEFDRLHDLISPPVLAGSSGLPRSACEQWNSAESNRLWLASMLGHPTFRLALSAAREIRAPHWSGAVSGQEALIDGALRNARLEGFNDFVDQLEGLCLPPIKDEGRIRDDSDEEVEKWAEQTGRRYVPRPLPPQTSEEPPDEGEEQLPQL
jgi:hypothetical protein